MIITVLQIWLGEGYHWGFDLIRIEPIDRALLSIYKSRQFGWDIEILFFNVL